MGDVIRYCDVCSIETCEPSCFSCGQPTTDWATHKALIASRFEAPDDSSRPMTIKFDPVPEPPPTKFDPEVATVAW